MNIKGKFKLSSTQIVMLGFVALILVGSLLLMCPFSSASGKSTDYLTALFTSTTSVSVTGLVVVDTFSHWSLVGKIIILLLIQLGGFGVVTVYSLVLLALNKKFSLKDRVLIQDYYDLDSMGGLIRFLTKVVKGTFLIEGIGMVLYLPVFIKDFGFVKGIWVSLFTAISAFCNAGIDIIGADSLIPYRTNVLINCVTMFLIIMGGLGFIVWFDVMNTIKYCKEKKIGYRKIWSRLGEHSRLVIVLTMLLILVGTVFTLIFEFDNPDTIGDLNWGKKVMVSLFQSVTFRTAGFASVPQGALTPLTALMGLLFMFIGGSPVGTAGGVKTVTMFILMLNVVSFVRQRDEAVVFNRSVSHELINKATAVVTVSLSFTLMFLGLLVATNDVSVLDASYEIFSATATVGLSRGITASLNNAGRIIMICAMYLGRIGPISMTLFFTTKPSKKNKVNYAEGHFKVG